LSTPVKPIRRGSGPSTLFARASCDAMPLRRESTRRSSWRTTSSWNVSKRRLSSRRVQVFPRWAMGRFSATLSSTPCTQLWPTLPTRSGCVRLAPARFAWSRARRRTGSWPKPLACWQRVGMPCGGAETSALTRPSCSMGVAPPSRCSSRSNAVDCPSRTSRERSGRRLRASGLRVGQAASRRSRPV